jgi:hypothetical protein
MMWGIIGFLFGYVVGAVMIAVIACAIINDVKSWTNKP